jgi:hypothetical protein
MAEGARPGTSDGNDRNLMESPVYAVPVPEVDEGQAPARAGRCANHPAVARVGVCDVCGRPLCLACATPVRGRLIGPECLPTVLEVAPPARPIPAPVPHGGDRIAAAGFAAVVILSAFSWSKGLVSGPFSGWTWHWSLAACAMAVAGLTVSVMAWRRPRRPVGETAAEGALAVLVGAASILHAEFPPSLSEPNTVPLLALLAAAVALSGAATKAMALRRVAINHETAQ